MTDIIEVAGGIQIVEVVEGGIEIIEVGIQGPPGADGATDHGALTGLADDDHSAVYLRYTIGLLPPISPRIGDFWMVIT